MMDTQPVEEQVGVEVETGNSPCLDPVPADTAEHDVVESPGQPTESANLDVATMPKISPEGGNEIAADHVTGEKDEPGESSTSQEEPPNLEPEFEVKQEASTPHSSEDPAGANMEPLKDAVIADLETAKEKKEATESPKVEQEKLEDGETPAKKPKVADQEEATTDPKKVFCEE